ncbi:hypothetical protein STEG23_036214 [Scotinomys teguina]
MVNDLTCEFDCAFSSTCYIHMDPSQEIAVELSSVANPWQTECNQRKTTFIGTHGNASKSNSALGTSITFKLVYNPAESKMNENITCENIFLRCSPSL